jgi:hypothetical protein
MTSVDHRDVVERLASFRPRVDDVYLISTVRVQSQHISAGAENYSWLPAGAGSLLVRSQLDICGFVRSIARRRGPLLRTAGETFRHDVVQQQLV